MNNKQHLKDQIAELGNLYEEGKDLCAKLLPTPATNQDLENFGRMRAILKEMRDLAASQMKNNYGLH